MNLNKNIWVFQRVLISGYRLWFSPSPGYSAVLLKYDGSNISIVYEDTTKFTTFSYIYGSSWDNIYVCGLNGSLSHYDGAKWEKIDYPDTLEVGPIFTFSNGTTYFISNYYDYPKTEGYEWLYFNKLKDGVFKTLDSCRLDIIDGISHGATFGRKKLWAYNESKIYSIDYGVATYSGSSWKLETWDDYQYEDIKGTSWNDIYVVGHHGTITRYNGEKWIGIREYDQTIADFYGVMPFKSEVFILVYYQGNTYVVRGKVK